MAILAHRHFPFHLETVKETLKKPWLWYFGLGLVLITLGAVAISYAVFTTLVSVVFWGSLLVAGSIAMIFYATRFWRKNWRDFFLYTLMGILYGAAGLLMIINPMLGAVSLTFALSIFYLLLGASRIGIAFTQPAPNRGWMLVSGAISLALGGFIWFYWPINSLWVIGLFVGIDIGFAGWWLAVLSWSTRNISRAIHPA